MEIVSLSRTENALLEYLDNQEDNLVEVLQALLAFRTVTPQDGQRAADGEYFGLVNFVEKIMNEIGVNDLVIWEQDSAALEAFPGSGVNPDRSLFGMPILVAVQKGVGEGKSLILNGHYDVVPTEELSSWTFDPYEGEISQGKVYGRGACDMKGGIAAMLAALQALKELNISLMGDVIVQLVPDEEMSCMGTLACCQRGYQADAALIPEPTDMQVLIAMRGSFYGQISVKGRAGHTEMTQPDWTEGGAVNAISKAQMVLAALEEINIKWRTRPEKQHALLDPDVIVPTGISGGAEWAVTYPDQVTISFGVMTSSDREDVCQELEDFVREYVSTDSWLRENPPIFSYEPVWHYGAEIPAEEPIVQLGLKVLDQLGYSSQVCGMGSLTDAVHLINYSKIPTISIGPAGQPAHMVDEHVEINELVALSKAIALILLRWCGVQGS